MCYSYPAVLHDAEEGGYYVTFPDLPECMTQGETMPELYKMSQGVLQLAIRSRITEKGYFPLPTNPMLVRRGFKTEQVFVVSVEI